MNYIKNSDNTLIELNPDYINSSDKTEKVYCTTNELLINNKPEIVNNHLEKAENCKIFFLENISHEIKTPLNGILGFSELMAKNNLPQEKIIEFANLIHFCGNQLLNTFNNFIEIAKVESGIIPLKPDKCNLNELFSNLYNHFISSKNKTKIKLKYHKNETIKNIFTDPIVLHRIFEHLLNNAFKFTHSGEIEFGYHYPYEKDKLLFYVKDTGIGIPKQKWHTIFEKFRQVDESSRRSYKGTGLGLTIAQGYIKKLGGQIWLESEIDKGTTFYFTVPLQVNEN